MKEQSHFGNWWLWVMLWVFVLFFGYAFIQQIVLEQPLGDELLGDHVIIGFLIFFLLILGVMWLTKLSIHVKEEGFEYQFFPWHKKPILLSWNKIHSVKTREVIVMGEFGSYGLRIKEDTLAMMANGNVGVELRLTNGAVIVFSSKKAKQVAAAIQHQLQKKTI